ncbi:MAG TPA: mechanosensitive ion channel family protein [Rubrobacteraceae bacterium]|nr:mechanosensitive ion channel family protein [Rubrobacteraceae bacterium]
MPDNTHDLVRVLTEFTPRLVGAVLVLLLALLVALFLQRLVARFLEKLGLDDLFEQTGASNSLMQVGYDAGPSRLLGIVLFWGVMLTGLAAALSVLGLSSLQSTMDQIVNLSGRALVALVILIAGVMFAGWLAEMVAREADRSGLRSSGGFRRAVFITIVSISALLAAGQLGLETSILLMLAIVVLATIGLVAALAIGQGLALLSSNVAAGRYVQDGTEVGDVISVDGIEGTVEEMGHASITLRSEDGYLYRIPNRTLLESVVRKQERRPEERGPEE